MDFFSLGIRLVDVQPDIEHNVAVPMIDVADRDITCLRENLRISNTLVKFDIECFGEVNILVVDKEAIH